MTEAEPLPNESQKTGIMESGNRFENIVPSALDQCQSALISASLSFLLTTTLTLFAQILTNRPRWDMYASLRGASSTEDSAKLDYSSTWTWLARATTSPPHFYSQRGFSVPTELPTSFADTFHSKELVPRPLRPRSESTKTCNPSLPARTPITLRATRASVSDLVGKFESKDSASGSPTPIRRAAAAPSSRLRSIYWSKLPSASSSAQIFGQSPPRKRLISSETVQEEGGPFTLNQVSAATSFTTARTRDQTTISELPAAPADQVSLRKDIGVQASFERHDQTTQARSKVQGAKAEHPASQLAVQISSACRDQAAQVGLEDHSPEIEVPTRFVDQGVQTTQSSGHFLISSSESHREISKANGEGSSHDQASQTGNTPVVERSLAQSNSKLPILANLTAESERESKRVLNSEHIIIKENLETHLSSEAAPIAESTCSTTADTRRHEFLECGVSFQPNTITIEFPEGAKVHMLRRIRGGKIVIGPSVLSRATSSEALAQGQVYTAGHILEQEPKSAPRSSQSASSAPHLSTFSSSSLERRQNSSSEGAVLGVSRSAENSHGNEANQQLTSKEHETVQDSETQPPKTADREATPQAGELAISNTTLAELPNAAASTTQAGPRARTSNKRREPSVPYWFESEDEDPKHVGPDSRAIPQAIAQFPLVPAIRVQRPSTDSDMLFGLGTKAVKPSSSVSPFVHVAPTPVQPTDNLAVPSTYHPTTSTVGKKHLRGRLRNRNSKKTFASDHTDFDKVGVRDRIKRQGRKKLIFRKKVLRFLLGKELAELVSQDLEIAGNTKYCATGALQATNDVYGELSPSVASHTPLPQPALPLGVTPLAPAQMDGSDDRSTMFDQSSLETALAPELTPTTPALDGSDERKAKRDAKKEIKRQKEQERTKKYELAKNNLEALTSTPCIKCGGQRAYILNFVFENKSKILKYEEPEMKLGQRGMTVADFVEGIECCCRLGTSSAAYGSPGAVSKAKEMNGKPNFLVTSVVEGLELSLLAPTVVAAEECVMEVGVGAVSENST